MRAQLAEASRFTRLSRFAKSGSRVLSTLVRGLGANSPHCHSSGYARYASASASLGQSRAISARLTRRKPS